MSLLNLIPAPWNLVAKIVLPVLLLGGALGFGYYEGVKHQKVVYQSKIVEKVVTQTKYVTEKEQPKETAQLSTSKKNYDNIVSKIPQITPPVVSIPGCPSPDWGADTISLLNSQRGSLPSE